LDFLPTMRDFIEKAFIPVGHTLYVYGGGWNENDDGASIEARTVGEAKGWRAFYATQGSGYSYKNFLRCSSLGLDCTGYIGWVLYNLFNTENYKNGFVFRSDILGDKLSEKGLGWVERAENVKEHILGDIFFSKKHRHAYISLGECEDKSVVLLHSSPPGVILSGTESLSGKNSLAQKTVNKFMREKYPEWSIKFPCTDRGRDYLFGYDRFRFFNLIVADPEELTRQRPDCVLDALKLPHAEKEVFEEKH